MRVEFLVLFICLSGACACRGTGVRISGLQGDKWSYPIRRILSTYSSYSKLNANYGETFNIYCSGNYAKNLRIEGEGIYENRSHVPAPSGQLVEVNLKTLQLTVEKPAVGLYHYKCTHEETNCSALLVIEVMPVMTIVAPNVHQKPFRLNRVHYFVPIDEVFEVFCDGSPELKIGYIDEKTGAEITDIETISLKETTVRSKKQWGTSYSSRILFCQHRPSGATTRSVKIVFDYIPAAANLRCTELENQINCSWSVYSTGTTFTLFYTDEDGNSVRVYEDFSGSKNKKTRSCEWSLLDAWEKGLELSEKSTLTIQACNNFYCSNQTYTTDRKTIAKTGSPQDLELLRITSHTAVVTWMEPWTTYLYKIPKEYKLTYQLPAQGLNGSSSQITCNRKEFSYLDKCEGELRLPCPGAVYEVEVYAKFTSTPRANDAYWSDPACITVRTEPHDSTDPVDPACLKEPEPIDNKCHCLCN